MTDDKLKRLSEIASELAELATQEPERAKQRTALGVASASNIDAVAKVLNAAAPIEPSAVYDVLGVLVTEPVNIGGIPSARSLALNDMVQCLGTRTLNVVVDDGKLFMCLTNDVVGAYRVPLKW